MGVVGRYRSVAERLAGELAQSLKGEVEAIVLYGSVAVGEASEDSDIDILVVTKDRSRNLYHKISSIRTRVDLDNGTLTTLIHMSRDEFELYLKSGSPFLEDVLRNGVALYDGGFFKRLRKSFNKEG